LSALTHFQSSITAADDLISMYGELRGSRGLGRRGPLDAANIALLSLPRAAVVAAVSALDAYVHAVLYERIPTALQANPVPNDLCELMSSAIPIKNANGFRDALPVLIAPDSLKVLFERVRDNNLAFLAFQAPEKVIAAYQLIGHNDIFDAVSDIWPGPRSEAEDIKRTLAGYVKRRNQIAHEGDHQPNGQPRPMQPEYAQGCRDFITSLVTRLNRVVYGV
jgi:hypothetical protein